jgi:hypothetical protein
MSSIAAMKKGYRICIHLPQFAMFFPALAINFYYVKPVSFFNPSGTAEDNSEPVFVCP